MSEPRVIVIEPMPPEICEACGKLDELRPYGKRKANGARLWVCFDCGMKDRAEVERALDERFRGELDV
jgi:hypothetical protein